MQSERTRHLPATSVSAVAASILALIQSRPRSPTQAEIENLLGRLLDGGLQTSPLLAELRHLRTAILQAVREEGELEGTPAHAAACARSRMLQGRLHALAEQIWTSPVTTWSDVVPRCELALRWIDRNQHGDLEGLSKDAWCMWERSAAHLVRAVAELGGCDVCE